MAYDTWRHATLDQLDALAEVHRVVSAVPPAQLNESAWWRSGPYNPPDGTTVMSAATWFACSPEGQRRGLVMTSTAGIPRHEPSRQSSFEAMGQALACSWTEASVLFGAGETTMSGGYRDEGDGHLFVLRRLEHVLHLHGRSVTGRRRLSSR